MKNQLEDKGPRILISRPDRIGDVVLSTPLPREIKIKYPKSFIAVLVRDYTKDIYLNNSNVDEIIIYKEDEPFLTLTKRLRKYDFTHSLILLPNEKINYAVFFSGIKKRIGVGHKFYQFVSNSKSVYRNKYIPLRHEADYCADEIRKLQVIPHSINPEIYLTESEKEEVNKIKLSLAPNGEKIIGINSTSGNSAPNLKPAEYSKLIKKLLNVDDIKIVITDLNPPAELIGIENISYINIENTLRSSILNFASLDILISASTGPMHIAAALKVKTISLFCPLPACSPELWGPKGNDSIILLPSNKYCGITCSGNPKDCNFEGNEGLNSDKIFNAVKQSLIK